MTKPGPAHTLSQSNSGGSGGPSVCPGACLGLGLALCCFCMNWGNSFTSEVLGALMSKNVRCLVTAFLALVLKIQNVVEGLGRKPDICYMTRRARQPGGDPGPEHPSSLGLIFI